MNVTNLRDYSAIPAPGLHHEFRDAADNLSTLDILLAMDAPLWPTILTALWTALNAVHDAVPDPKYDSHFWISWHDALRLIHNTIDG